MSRGPGVKLISSRPTCASCLDPDLPTQVTEHFETSNGSDAQSQMFPDEALIRMISATSHSGLNVLL